MKRLTPEEIAAKKELILRRLRKGMTRAAAAESVGLHRKTVYEWSKSDEAFGDAIANRVALFGRELVSAMVGYPETRRTRNVWKRPSICLNHAFQTNRRGSTSSWPMRWTNTTGA